MARLPRPYLQSSFKINFNIEENLSSSSEVFEKLVLVFQQNGFCREVKKISKQDKVNSINNDELKESNVDNGKYFFFINFCFVKFF